MISYKLPLQGFFTFKDFLSRVFTFQFLIKINEEKETDRPGISRFHTSFGVERDNILKVLVVDDSSDIRNIIKKVLTAANYEVETEDNGAGALQTFARFMPDVVLLDISMPIMDGKETLRKILTLSKNAKVIMVTAVDDYEEINSCLKTGAIGYLVKPFDTKEIIAAIKSPRRMFQKGSGAFFSIVRNKIEADIRKMFDPSANVFLKDVIGTEQEKSLQSFSPSKDFSQIRRVDKLIKQLKPEAPEGAIGYMSEYGGQQQGAVISFVNEEGLTMLMRNSTIHSATNSGESQAFSDTMEFFNILNQKVVSALSVYTHLILERSHIRLYDETYNKYSSWEEILEATFDIISYDKIIPLKILLCSGENKQTQDNYSFGSNNSL